MAAKFWRVGNLELFVTQNDGVGVRWFQDGLTVSRIGDFFTDEDFVFSVISDLKAVIG